MCAARVLLVEDEMLVQMLAVEFLEDAGCEVHTAASAAEALRKAEAMAGGIDAAVVDVGLPDRKGDALAGDLRALHPSLPILLATGYQPPSFRDDLEADRLVSWLNKPYTGEQLVDALRALGVAC
jgi:CheY-like chemotaxis protein